MHINKCINLHTFINFLLTTSTKTSIIKATYKYMYNPTYKIQYFYMYVVEEQQQQREIATIKPRTITLKGETAK